MNTYFDEESHSHESVSNTLSRSICRWPVSHKNTLQTDLHKV